jgi:hypothetical protein
MTCQLHMHFTGQTLQQCDVYVHRVEFAAAGCHTHVFSWLVTDPSWLQLEAVTVYACTGRSLRISRWTFGGLWFENIIVQALTSSLEYSLLRFSFESCSPVSNNTQELLLPDIP